MSFCKLIFGFLVVANTGCMSFLQTDINTSSSLLTPIAKLGPPYPLILINNNLPYTNSLSVVLSLQAYPAVDMYVTNTAQCSSGGVWESIAFYKSWALTTANSTNTVYAKFRDVLGNESDCVSSSIIHDTQAPTPVTAVVLGSVPNGLNLTPTISWTPGTDVGGAGLNRHEVQIYRTSDDSVVSPWRIMGSGSIYYGTALTAGQAYYVKIRSTDGAGNVSALTQSSSWTAVDSTTKVWVWGSNLEGQLGLGQSSNPLLISSTAIGGLSFTQIGSGGFFTCGLTSAGAAYCWGYNFYGQLGNGTTTNSTTPVAVNGGLVFKQISVSANSVCGLILDGTPYCWGSSTYYSYGTTPTPLAGAPSFASISLSAYGGCGLTVAGAAYCWGSDSSGQLGNGPPLTNSPTPVLVSGGLTFKQISAGGSVCALTFDGTAYCWGYGGSGSLGNGGTSDSPVPVAVAGGFVFAKLANKGATCGITQSGDAYCWGPVVGDGTATQRNSPTLVSGGHIWKEISLAVYGGNTCGLATDNLLYCWGYQGSMILGNPNSTTPYLPTVVLGLASFSKFDLGGYHGCALISDGNVACWGQNTSGQAGFVSSLLTTPVHQPSNLSFSKLTSGRDHSCGLTAAGVAYCWGNNGSGQLGTGDNLTYTAPQPVAGGLTFTNISAGNQFTCAVSTSGAGYCWGGNFFGNLGNGSTASANSPTAISGSLTLASISPGQATTCALTTAGAAYCWGWGASGMLGNGGTASSLVPVAVSGGITFSSLSFGAWQGCGLDASGNAYCWGNGPTTPTAVGPGINFAQISVGNYDVCGVSTTNVAYCWGQQYTGGLGTGSNTAVSPTVILGGYSWTKIAASFGNNGNSHICGITTTGALYCWGYNANGQLGIGNSTDQGTPMPVSGGLTFTDVAVGTFQTLGITP